MRTPQKICPDCGKELPAGAPAGMCPNCLLSFGVAAAGEAAAKPTMQIELEPAAPGQSGGFQEQPGARIGRYKLLELIGEGGFGTVWMAEQEEPVRRRVALKIIKLGMDTREVVARFEAERQALAMMDHPNIARVFDGGATENGRPYFVMELVKGVRLTDYCDAQKLSTEDRLKLFMEVCEAVQHAHQKGIIHRDLKPSNVLVTVRDDQAVPKVIDFGIAKATGARLTDKTFFTGFNQVIGTPVYMSPEQAGLGSLDIDTRSDIYALGVILYELLTGRTPFSKEELAAAGLDEILRTIREKEPPKPSTRLSTLTQEELLATANKRSSPPAKFNRLLRGELDWIVMKCLEKDRARRYETANGLARDLECHLNDEPVVAAAPSLRYQLQKLVQRNRVLFTAIGAVLAALLFGLALSSWLFFKERQTRRRAEAAEGEQSRLRQNAQTEALKSRQIADFLKNMLGGVRPRVAMGQDTTMLREITDRTRDRLAEELKDQPAVEAELRSTLGIVYRELGEWQKAEAMHREGLVAARKLAGENDRLLAWCFLTLADTLRDQNKLAEAEPLYREGIKVMKKLADPTVFPELYADLAGLLNQQRRFTEADAVIREALEIWRKTPNSNGLARTLATLAGRLHDEGNFSESESAAREGLTICRQYHSTDTGLLAWLAGRLGYALREQGKWAEAESAFRESITNAVKAYPKGFDRFGCYVGMGQVLVAQSKLNEAESLLTEFAVVYRAAVGKEPISGDLIRVFNVLVPLLRDRGKVAEAEALLAEVVATYPKALQMPPVTGDWIISLAIFGDVCLDLQRWTEAEKVCRDGLALCREQTPNHALRRQRLARGVGLVLVHQEKWAEAEPFFREAITNAARAWPNDPTKYESHFTNLLEILQRQGKAVKLEILRAELMPPALPKSSSPAANSPFVRPP